MMEEYQLHKHIVCIDLKSFFASVECSLLGVDPFTTPLVVTDKARGKGAIVLAVSPCLRKMGVPGRCRIRELPKNVDIIYRKPQMQKYLSYSAQIIGIYLRYLSDNDIYVYSIDEAFMDFTEYLNYYHKTDLEIANEIMKTIYKETGIYSSCGIGPNMLMAKLALDIGSKSKKDFQEMGVPEIFMPRIINKKSIHSFKNHVNKMVKKSSMLKKTKKTEILKEIKNAFMKREMLFCAVFVVSLIEGVTFCERLFSNMECVLFVVWIRPGLLKTGLKSEIKKDFKKAMLFVGINKSFCRIIFAILVMSKNDLERAMLF